MKLADLMRPGVLRAVATATPATIATHTDKEAGSPVAKVATVAVAINDETVTALILAKACKLTGHALEQLPEQLRADLLARDDASTDYMALVIRDDAAWHGWDGRAVALADYAPGGRFYVDH